MSKYIEVDTLIRKYIDTDIKKFSNSDVKIVLENLKQNILKAPTIEPKQGEWIITEQDNGHKWTHRKCSECGKGVIEPLGVSAMNFCPNCGVRMKGAYDE
ncbi:MAG: hypothetical protein IKE74_03440 [Mogibacterium sp.]|nr:hypothetical protein [Mogibacterium sp.]